MAEIISFEKPKVFERHCTFCNASESKSFKFFGNSNENAFICDKCVSKARERMKNGN